MSTIEGDISAASLLDLVASVAPVHRRRFEMNATTCLSTHRLRDEFGAYIWTQHRDTLHGFPVKVNDTMPHATPGNLAVAFGDFDAGAVNYLRIEKPATALIRRLLRQ